MTVRHAYAHWIGRTVGINIEGHGIVAAQVMTPDVNQDHNLINVATADGTWHQVRAMDTYRADFVNAEISLAPRLPLIGQVIDVEGYTEPYELTVIEIRGTTVHLEGACTVEWGKMRDDQKPWIYLEFDAADIIWTARDVASEATCCDLCNVL